MDPLTIGILGIIVLILLILTGMPVGAALFSAGARSSVSWWPATARP